MRRPDRLAGPEQATARDIDPLNRLFSEAFTDRYSRDGLTGVRVPFLSPAVWRYALEDAGAGAMLWRDGDGELAGFNIVHRSGSEGWMGPLAVRPDSQSAGLGSTMVRSGVDWLRAQGARTIGLETMPRTMDNIGFYSRLGFAPGHLTVTLVRDVGVGRGQPAELGFAAGEWRRAAAECRKLTDTLCPGVDFTREIQLTQELQLGDLSLVRTDGRVTGFALWHSAPLAAGRPRDELRVLKLGATGIEPLTRLVGAVEAAARGEHLRRISIRCQTAFADAYAALIADQFRVHWTDLRMTCRGFPERTPASGVLLSNWEI
jgi:GNAT superfamily N-acetyltransferase